MSNTKPWINWIALIALLVIFGLAAALWPTISASINIFGGGTAVTQVPVESHPIVIEIPLTTLPTGAEVGGQTMVLEPLTAVIGLAAFLFGAILIVGLIITLIYAFLDKLRDKTVNSAEFKEHQTALANKEKEYFKEVRQDRQADPTPENPEMMRWATVSTSILILIFATLTGMVIAQTLWPHWYVIDGDELLTPGLAVIAFFFLVTLIFLVIRMSPRRIGKVAESDKQGIPQDTIAVLVSGLLIIVLGIGFAIYINLP